MRLSLCVIARDEADYLDQCLRSVAGLVDEIVVVDTGSADSTSATAQRHGARVVEATWTDDFAAARNRSLQEATGEWVLVLDCDEVLATSDHADIRRAISAPQADAYRLTTRNYTDRAERSGWTPISAPAAETRGYRGWYPTTKVRLWRHSPEVRFSGAVHELVEPSIQACGYRIGDCLVPVHHYGSGDEKKRPSDRYLAAGQGKVQVDPDDLRARYELAIACRDAGRLEEALEAILAVVSRLDAAGSPNAVKALLRDHQYVQEELVRLVHGDVLDRLERLDEARAAYEGVVARYPHSFQAHNNLGTILSRCGELPAALEHYRRGAELASDNEVLAGNLARLETRLAAPHAGSAAADPPPARAKHSLSVCVIVRDEATLLDRCLHSVADVADEIVVVDTGSASPDCEDVARRHGARLEHFTWRDDFAAARNASLEAASCDWILWLDADDYLLPQDRQGVARAKDLTPDRGLYFTLVNEGGADRTRFRQVKMFPNRPDIRFVRPVHETVVSCLRELGLPLVATDVEVRHTGYADPIQAERKRAYYLRLMLEWLQRVGEDFDISFRIGHTFYSAGETEKAGVYFDRLLSAVADEVQPQSLLRRAAVFRGRCHLEAGALREAVAVLQRAIDLQAGDILAELSMGDALTKLGEFERALPHLQGALDGSADPHFPVDVDVLRYSCHFFLGQCHQALGRFDAARAAFEAAGRLQPQRPEAAQALAQLQGHSTAPVPEGSSRRTRAPVEVPAPAASDSPESGRPNLTLCMIVKNEEERLDTCLDSVDGLVDEIVVVDTGSSDATIEIAKRHGARIGHFEWCDDWAAARNESLKMATGEWIMWLDADDILPAEYHEQIRQLTVGKAADKVAYFFALDDRGYENVSCLQMRLFPNLPGVVFEMPVHEQVTPSLGRLGVEMVSTDIRVVHTGYTTPEIVRAKKERYLRIMEDWLREHPQDYIVRSHVALTYHTTGKLDEAMAAYRAIVEDSSCHSDGNYVVYTTALLFLGRTYLKMGELDEAERFMGKAEEVDPDYVLTRFSLAELYERRGDPARALKYARAVLDGGRQMTFFPIDQTELTYAALIVSARAQTQLGNIAQAEADYRRASDIPVARRSEALGSLSDLYKATGREDGAFELLQQAREIDPQNAKHMFNTGMLHLERGDMEQAAHSFEEVLGISPDYAPALLNLGYIAKSAGDWDGAGRRYRQLLAAHPDHLDGRANLGHLLLAEERYAEAADEFEQVRTQDDSLADINLGLLMARAAQGRWDGALVSTLFEPFPELRSQAQLDTAEQAADPLIRLGAELVRGDHIKSAEFAFATVVFALEAGDPAGRPEFAAQTPDARAFDVVLRARRCLGQVQMGQGQYWKAIAQYEAILRADPRDGEAFKCIGDCYAKLGAADAAQMAYGQSGGTEVAPAPSEPPPPTGSGGLSIS